MKGRVVSGLVQNMTLVGVSLMMGACATTDKLDNLSGYNAPIEERPVQILQDNINSNIGKINFQIDSSNLNEVKKSLFHQYSSHQSIEKVEETTPIKQNKQYVEHVVEKNQFLSHIGKIHNISYQKIADYNGISNPHDIDEGQILKIPIGEGVAQKTTFVEDVKLKEEAKNNYQTEITKKITKSFHLGEPIIGDVKTPSSKNIKKKKLEEKIFTYNEVYAMTGNEFSKLTLNQLKNVEGLLFAKYEGCGDFVGRYKSVKGDLKSYINKHGVPELFGTSVIKHESCFFDNLISENGAVSFGQIMKYLYTTKSDGTPRLNSDGTIIEQCNPLHKDCNLNISMKYLSLLLEDNSSVKNISDRYALASLGYNRGQTEFNEGVRLADRKGFNARENIGRFFEMKFEEGDIWHGKLVTNKKGKELETYKQLGWEISKRKVNELVFYEEGSKFPGKVAAEMNHLLNKTNLFAHLKEETPIKLSFNQETPIKFENKKERKKDRAIIRKQKDAERRKSLNLSMLEKLKNEEKEWRDSKGTENEKYAYKKLKRTLGYYNQSKKEREINNLV